MHLILTGATGLVGSGVLDAMIKMKDVTQITLLSRRPVQMAEDARDPRVRVITHEDFTSYPQSLLDRVADATGCVWALGISQTQVGKEEYVKITKDYALAAAEAFESLRSTPDKKGEPFHFIFVSGAGTTHNPGLFTPFYGRVKGETELLLAEMRKNNPLFKVDSVRPSLVDWKHHDAIKPYLRQSVVQETTLAVLGPMLRGIASGQFSPTEPLGRFLAECAMGKWEGKLEGHGIDEVGDTGLKVVHNAGFRRLAGLD